jgi:hypothetical protein
MKRYALLLLLLFLTGCNDQDLAKVSKALVITQKTIGEVQTDVISANAQGLVSTETTRTVLELCNKVNLAGKEATALTRTLNQLDVTSKGQILEILKPVIAALGNSIDVGLVEIKDQVTRDKIRLALLTIQSALNSIQIIVAGGA